MSSTGVEVPTRPASRETQPGKKQTRIRADIQALRALAVLLVVVYHFWPQRLTGGFVGVDVFFVISGFLITSHLVAQPPRTWSALGEFWGRRIRRLLPASFVVIGATLIASLLLAPATTWVNIAKQGIASVLYVENWFLAAEAVDYLAEDNAATPFQHFWSLSVEEQFYLVWPILILIALALTTKFARISSRAIMMATIAIVVFASLAASVILTGQDPSAAYFVSWTRLWELGAGAILAVGFGALQRALGGNAALRGAIAVVGFAMILSAALFYDSTTPFPGVAALLPVVGTVLVIGGAIDESRWKLSRPVGWKPVRFLGDISYSLYLWHWPAVVLLPLLLGRNPRWMEKVVAIALLIALAWATKVFIEDRFRGRMAFGERLRGSYLFMASGMVLVVVAGAATIGSVQYAEAQAQAGIEQQLAGDDPCLGSLALANEGCAPHGDALLTDPSFAAADKPDAYQDECWILGDFSMQKTCEYGSDDPDALKVALIGNSHAGHWLPALQEISRVDPWHITTFLISECYTVGIPIKFETETKTQNCSQWNDDVIAEIEQGGYDLVVFSNRTSRPLEGVADDQRNAVATSAYSEVLDRWTTANVPVLVLRDTPYATDLESVPDCVAQHLEDLSACDGTFDRRVQDPLADAADASTADLVESLDLTNRICQGDVCYSVVGGVIVYFDRGHLSATYARTLAGEIAEHAAALLQRATH